MAKIPDPREELENLAKAAGLNYVDLATLAGIPPTRVKTAFSRFGYLTIDDLTAAKAQCMASLAARAAVLTGAGDE